MAASPINPRPIQRSFTLPPRLLNSNPSNGDRPTSPDAGAETLYYHPSARIVSFTPPTTDIRSASSPRSVDLDYPVDAIETLPWASTTERTVAAGPLKFEKIPGSTAFLKSGQISHPCLRNTQCWCVDGVSKFVLRVRQFQYYRIELPSETEEDKARVDVLKIALPKILRYEVTPCPFMRGFSVELPDEGLTPRRRGTWKPRPQSLSFETPVRATFEHSNQFETEHRERSGPNADSGADRTDDREAALPSQGQPHGESPGLETPTVPILIKKPLPRSVTAPPHMLAGFVPKKLSDDIPVEELIPETSSLASSLDSFHSFHSPISPLPPSPPYSDPPSPSPPGEDTINGIARRQHARGISELTITPKDQINTNEERFVTSNRPSTPKLLKDEGSDGDWPEVSTPGPAETVRRRFRSSRKRTLSPLPPPSTLFTPSPKSPGNHLTAAILQKTCSVVLGPPIQFLAMLLHLAARMAGNEPHGLAFGYNEAGEKISYLSNVEGADGEIWGEDDFGVPLNASPSRTREHSPEYGGSWEVD